MTFRRKLQTVPIFTAFFQMICLLAQLLLPSILLNVHPWTHSAISNDAFQQLSDILQSERSVFYSTEWNLSNSNLRFWHISGSVGLLYASVANTKKTKSSFIIRSPHEPSLPCLTPPEGHWYSDIHPSCRGGINPHSECESNFAQIQSVASPKFDALCFLSSSSMTVCLP